MFIDEKEPPSPDMVLAKMFARIKHRDHCSTVGKVVDYGWDVFVYAKRIRWVLMALAVCLFISGL